MSSVFAPLPTPTPVPVPVPKSHVLLPFWDLPEQDANANLHLEDWTQKHVVKFIPTYGNIVMLYWKEEKTFYYYADVSCPYTVLNEVAAVYVKRFLCRDFFEDTTWIDEVVRRIKKEEEVVPELPKVNLANIIRSKNNPDVFAKKVVNPRTQMNLIKTLNCFVKKGRFSDFNPLAATVTPAKRVILASDNSENISTHSFKISTATETDSLLPAQKTVAVNSVASDSAELSYQEYCALLKKKEAVEDGVDSSVEDGSNGVDSLELPDDDGFLVTFFQPVGRRCATLPSSTELTPSFAVQTVNFSIE
jgi:hypothetical protein